MADIRPHIFNGVVWTEQVASVLINSYGFLEEFTNSEPVWGNIPILHIIVSLTNSKKMSKLFCRKKCKVIILNPDTKLKELSNFGLEKYSISTMEEGLKALKQIKGVTGTNLGIILHKNNYQALSEVDSVCEKIRSKNNDVIWSFYKLDSGKLFIGPSLTQMAKKILILHGVRPSLSLWLCSSCKKTQNLDDEPILDEEIQKNHLIKELNSAFINFESGVFVNTKGKTKELKSSAQNHEFFQEIFSAFKLAPPISCHYNCKILINKTGLPLCQELDQYSQIANDNLLKGRNLFQNTFTQGQCPWTHARWKEEDLNTFFSDGGVFDHRSGAIAFDPYLWTTSLVGRKRSLPKNWRKVVEYFEELIEVPWQQDRPNYKRILAAPTKIILRGEEYYSNLKNIAPWERINTMLSATNVLVRKKWLSKSLLGYSNLNEWKLCLAVFDQLRNAALQVAWFENQLSTLPSFKNMHTPEIRTKVQDLLDHTSHLYYATLAGRSDMKRLDNLRESNCWPSLYRKLNEIINKIKKLVDKNWKVDPSEPHIQANKLIRRWREADHPGENTIVALQAWDKFKKDSPVAVGIGWGGIELPMVYRQIATLIDDNCLPTAVAVHYSTYRGNQWKPDPAIRDLSPGENNIDSVLRGNNVLIFDDNSLSGRTIQQVAEYLFNSHETRIKAAYLTRISGERRQAQMRMYEHGVLNPELVDKFIFGFLGETPFSRAWSSELGRYKNPIGVFSLARRRILELLFANSSADRFDREGF